MRRLIPILLCLVLAGAATAPAQAAPDREGHPADVLCLADAVPCDTWYADRDGDGYGDDATERRAFLAPEGHVERGGDCDDTDPEVHPEAVEVYDGRDNDCSGAADDVVLVVAELMINPKAVSDTDGEWIEVTNVSEKPVRLDGVRVHVGSRACELDGVFDAGSRLVVARNGDPSANGGVNADVVCFFQLPNTAGAVLLAADTGALDAVDYTGWTVPDGASLSLDPGSHAPEANDHEDAWCAATTPLPSGDAGTPGEPNDPCGAEM